MHIQPVKTDIFQEGDDLFNFIAKYLKKIPEHSVIAVTSKIAALSERRTIIAENIYIKEKTIHAESDFAIPSKEVWLTIKDGMFMASAGIDESNANGKLILLPKDSFKTARELRKKLQHKYGVKRLGVLITDSHTAPMRKGVTGIALGYAGFCGIKDYRGLRDIFGRKFKFSQVNIADSLAVAAVLVMGEGNEQYPLSIIKEAPVEFCDKINREELRIDIKDDMYYPLFSNIIETNKARKQIKK
ncbi:MAG: coenzyme F420-0:L-glutamate ligase [bacterium]